MNFAVAVRSELEPMLRRILLLLLVVASSAGFVLPSAAQGAMDCEQVSLQTLADSCGGGNIAGSTCAVPCPAGACITPALARPESDANLAQPVARSASLDSDGVWAPDTAPPEHFVA